MIIGVAGGSGSGKTTFVRDLAARLGKDKVAIIQQDSYYFDRSHQFKGDGSLNFDHPDSIDWGLMAGHLRLLRDGRACEVPVYDFATHSRKASPAHMPPSPVILVDGILIFSPKEICDLLDLKIFIETSEPVRFERRLRRDVSERGRTPEGVREQYVTTVKPMHDEFVEPSKKMADKIFSGEKAFKDSVDKVLFEIRAELND